MRCFFVYEVCVLCGRAILNTTSWTIPTHASSELQKAPAQCSSSSGTTPANLAQAHIVPGIFLYLVCCMHVVLFAGVRSSLVFYLRTLYHRSFLMFTSTAVYLIQNMALTSRHVDTLPSILVLSPIPPLQSVPAYVKKKLVTSPSGQRKSNFTPFFR